MKHFTLPKEGGLIEKGIPADILHGFERIRTEIYDQSSNASDKIADIIVNAINACKDHVKSSWFKRTVTLEDAATIAAPAVPNTWLLDAMKELPEKYRIVIHLFYYEDWNIREIAQILHISESNVKTRLSRGRTLLKNVLKEEWADDE